MSPRYFKKPTCNEEIRSLCGALSVVRLQKSHWVIKINGKINVWKCKLIFSEKFSHHLFSLMSFQTCMTCCKITQDIFKIQENQTVFGSINFYYMEQKKKFFKAALKRHRF